MFSRIYEYFCDAAPAQLLHDTARPPDQADLGMVATSGQQDLQDWEG
ncbi:MAG: hypothetical protein OXU20_12290 [Myxococcales bacterium]|nr:hypothetical protein [Myxococcales bacterium]MDD9970735.1 hypothetical protein [Myxococcales bacterium]